MILYFFAIILTIVANIFYHISQRATPSGVNPLVSLIVTYITAIIGCIILFPLFPLKSGLTKELKQLNWTSFTLGLALIGLELGFLLAYRAGWNISLAAIYSNVAVTILLVPIGLLFFKENISLTNFIGLLVCILGLLLVNSKK